VTVLGKTAFIDDQDGRLLAQLLQGVGAQLIAHAIRVPHSTGKQALHALGSGFSGVFSQLPAIFALDATQQALQVTQHPAAWFRAGKARGNAGVQLGEQLCPLDNVGWGRLGSVDGGMLGLLHDFLLSFETSAVGIRTNRMSHLRVKIVTCFSGVLKKTIAQLLSATVVPWLL
jgi:hypothetical protein